MVFSFFIYRNDSWTFTGVTHSSVVLRLGPLCSSDLRMTEPWRARVNVHGQCERLVHCVETGVTDKNSTVSFTAQSDKQREP